MGYPDYRYNYYFKGGGHIFSRKSLITILITLVIISVLFALNPNPPKSADHRSGRRGDGEIKGPKSKGPQLWDNGTGAPGKGDGGHIEIRVVKDEKSGQVETLPWERDTDFLKAGNEHGTKVLMAAYRTVLPDPLPGEEYNVHLGARLLSGKIIEPGKIFSQNREIGPYDESKGFKSGPTYAGTQLITTIGGGVCKISSTLYNVAVLSNLEIVQRYNHSMPVPYVPYGQDATVAYGSRDFQFKNNTSFPILIWAEGIENMLYIAFYGEEKPPDIKWHHDVTDIQKAPILYKKNPELSPGVEHRVVDGMDGATVKSGVTVSNPDGTVEIKDMGTSYYRPMPSIIERND